MEKVKVRLICEGEKLDVDLEVIQKSAILKNMIEDTGKEGEIPIPNIQLHILRKVLEYCEHYRSRSPKEIKKPLRARTCSRTGPRSGTCSSSRWRRWTS